MRVMHSAQFAARTVAELRDACDRIVSEGCPPGAVVKKVTMDGRRPNTPTEFTVAWTTGEVVPVVASPPARPGARA